MTFEDLHSSLLNLLPHDWVLNISAISSADSWRPMFINLLNKYVVQIRLGDVNTVVVELCGLYFISEGGHPNDVRVAHIATIYVDKISQLKETIVPTMVYKIKHWVLGELTSITLSNLIASSIFTNKLIELYNPYCTTVNVTGDHITTRIYYVGDNIKIQLMVSQIKLSRSNEILEYTLRGEVYSVKDNRITSVTNIDLTDKLPNVDLMLGYSSAQLLNL